MLVLLGTVVRFAFGYEKELWRCAPDQIAWGLNLDLAFRDGGLAYHELIHYPHEGGSVILSLLAMLMRPLEGGLPPLSWAALVADALSRYVQISVAERVFNRVTAIWFAVWTVLAVPLLLPWGTVDFGLHALVAFVPFVFIRQAMEPHRAAWKLGVLAGLGGCLAYDCLIVVPAYLVWSFLGERDRKSRLLRSAGFLAGCVLGLLPHLALRIFPDNAFGLENMPALGVRGLEQEPLGLLSALPKLATVWTTTLPASFMLSSVDVLSPRMIASVVSVFLGLGLLGAVLRRREEAKAEWLIAMTVLMFTVAYAAGPLFFDRVDSKSYLPYRHFAFVLPLLVLIVISGLARLPRSAWLLGAWLALCSTASLAYMISIVPCPVRNDGAAGWVLARKYGHDPERLMSLLEVATKEAREELLRGYGWGMTTTLFEHGRGKGDQSMDRMSGIWSRLPESFRPGMLDGVRTAFTPGITPVLDKSIEPELLRRLEGVSIRR